MFRIVSFCLFWMLTFSLSAQTDEGAEGEGGIPEGLVKGTALLPYTHNYLSVMSSGYFSYKVEKADCSDHGEDVYSEADKIDQVIFNDSIIEVHLRIYDNCCYDFLWDPYLSDDGILDLIYTGYGTYCACNCCFGHVLYFKKQDYELEDRIAVKEIRINGKGGYKVNRTMK